MILNRSGCFAVSDLPSAAALVEMIVDGHGSVRVPIGYHLGVRIRLCFDALV
jgi:hypothetical protein